METVYRRRSAVPNDHAVVIKNASKDVVKFEVNAVLHVHAHQAASA